MMMRHYAPFFLGEVSFLKSEATIFTILMMNSSLADR